MLNYDSILSVYEDKLTLMQWLRKVEEALKGASATSFSVNKKGDATISFQINFDDGTSLESGDIILQQGESVTGASIVNGHLILTLSNGDELDAGDLGAVSGFSIDASQHLIVTYQDGTTNDLGAIFNGNVNISGDLNATGKISGGEIVETMTGYSGTKTGSPSDFTNGITYIGVCKNGNKITFVISGSITKVNASAGWRGIASFNVPAEVNAKLVTTAFGTADYVAIAPVDLYPTNTEGPVRINTDTRIQKGGGVNPTLFFQFNLGPLTLDIPYFFRLEYTFLLGENYAE